MSAFERIDSRIEFAGRIATVRSDTFRYADGTTAEREIVEHPGAVAMVAHDDEAVYLVRQPREPVGERALLELPAGKLDVEGEAPLECAKRELTEEIGKGSDRWTELKRVYASPGFLAEEVWIFEAASVYDVDWEPDPAERIEVVAWPLADLDGAIEACIDAQSLVGLMLLRQQRCTGR